MKLNNIQIRDAIQHLTIEASQLASMACAVYDAMEYSPNSEQTYFEAARMVGDKAIIHRDKMDSLLDCLL